MTLNEALDGIDVYEQEALSELRRHGVTGQVEARPDWAGRLRRCIVARPDLSDDAPLEVVAFANAEDCYDSADLMAWLGY